MQLVQQDYVEIKEKLRKNNTDLKEVQQQVKNLKTQQARLKSQLEEYKEIIEQTNNNTINTFVSCISFCFFLMYIMFD